MIFAFKNFLKYFYRETSTSHANNPKQPRQLSSCRFINIQLKAGMCCLSASLLFYFFPTLALSQSLSLHPLMDLRHEIRNLNQACFANPGGETCILGTKRIKRDLTTLSKICKLNRQDERCSLLYKPHKPPGWQLREFCLERPRSPRCEQRHELTIARIKQNARFCAKNPESRRCIPIEQRRPMRFAKLSDYCKVLPHKKACIVLERQRQKQRKPQEIETHTF